MSLTMKVNVGLCSTFMLFVTLLSNGNALEDSSVELSFDDKNETLLTLLEALNHTKTVSENETAKQIEKIFLHPFFRSAPLITTILRQITNSPRRKEKAQLFCLVTTTAGKHEERAIHIKNTWGRRCNNLLFISNGTDPYLPAVNPGGLRALLGDYEPDLKEAFTYAFTNYYDTIDWIFRATDQSFAVVENLRFLLADHDPYDKLVFGYRVKTPDNVGYMDGGAGYVLSKEGLRALVEEGFPDYCQESTTYGDVEIAKCLNDLGVEMADSRDSLGRHRFLPSYPGGFFLPREDRETLAVHRHSYYPLEAGPNCCSETWISSTVKASALFYLYEYMTHTVKVAGCKKNKRIPLKTTTTTPPSTTTSTTTTTPSPTKIKPKPNFDLQMYINFEGNLRWKGVRDRKKERQPKQVSGISSLIDSIKPSSLSVGLRRFFCKSENAPGVGNGLSGNRLLCLISTLSNKQMGRTPVVRDTWGERCDYFINLNDEKALTMSTAARVDETLAIMSKSGVKTQSTTYFTSVHLRSEDPTNNMSAKAEKRNNWGKIADELQYAYDNFLDKVDWILNVGDHSYVIIENLRALLEGYDPKEKYFFGCRLKNKGTSYGYILTQSGFVLSNAALKTFVEEVLTTDKQQGASSSDVALSDSLYEKGVKFVDGRDELSRFRFLPFSVEVFLMKDALPPSTFNWWFENTYYTMKIGPDCCSNTLTIMNHISPGNIYLYDFFLYTFKLKRCHHNSLLRAREKENIKRLLKSQ